MSEERDSVPDFKPKIPMWMQPHYDHLTPIQRWQCDLASVQEQQNSWMMTRLMEAGQHRTQINLRVDSTDDKLVRLADDVLPVIILVRNLRSIKSRVCRNGDGIIFNNCCD